MTVSSAIARQIVQFAGSYGVEALSLTKPLGITSSVLDDPDQRITLTQLDQLWQLAVSRTHDPYLGLHLGEQFDPNALGVVGYLMQNSPHLGEALQQVLRYGKLIGDVLDIRLSQKEGGVMITFVPVPAWQILSAVSLRQSVEYDMAFALRCFQTLTGQPLLPSCVSFAYEAAEPAVYEQTFQCQVRFGQGENTMVFDPQYLQLPIVNVHNQLLDTLEQFAQALLRQLTQQESTSQRVKQSTIRGIGKETLTVEQVANELAMSKRTLQRKLREEGSSFQKITDEVRVALALNYLREGNLSIGETAYLTGFSEAAAFHRFFKQQTGQTPQQYQTSGPLPHSQ